MPSALRVAYEVIAPILITAGLGFWVGRVFAPDPRTLSRIAIYLFIPAIVFRSSANSSLQPEEIGQIVLFVVVLYVILALIVTLIAKTQRHLGPALQSAFVLSALMGNSGNYGLSFVEFAFGADGLSIAVMVLIMTSTMANTLGIYVASAGAASVRQGLLNIVRVPLPYAILLGFVVKFGNIALPLPVERSVDLLSQAAVPMMITLLGLQMARIANLSELQSLYRSLAVVSAVRLLIPPVIILLLTALMGITGLTRDVLLVQLSTPTAVYGTLLATEFGSDARFVTAAIFVTTLASLVTLSIIMTLFVV